MTQPLSLGRGASRPLSWYILCVIRLGVRGKLIALALLILVVVSFGFTLLQFRLLRAWIEEDLEERAAIFAREVAASIGDRREFERGALLQREVQQIMAIRRSVLQLDVLEFTPNETGLIASSDAQGRLPFTARDSEVVRRGELVSRLVVEPTGRAWHVMAPITIDGAILGAIAVKFSLNRSDAREAHIRRWDLALTGTSVVVAGLLMAFASHLVVNRPIRRFLDAVQRVQRDGARSGVTVEATDEFAELARHFNEMVTRINAFNEALETRVRDATRELEARYHEVQRLHEALFATQRRLAHADRLGLAGRIMAEVAHEVGTPLHSVAGHLELLRQDLRGECMSKTVERRFSLMSEQLSRLAQIIEQLLDLTRRPPERPALVDVNRLAAETVDLVRTGLGAADLTLTVETALALPLVQGHASQLQQVILNLVTNAIDATGPGGSVIVRTQPATDPGFVALDVVDTGSGIDDTEIGHIFEPFFSTKAGRRGTGLGLFITAQIVREHRGRIDVRSARNKGTTVRVLLPAGESA